MKKQAALGTLGVSAMLTLSLVGCSQAASGNTSVNEAQTAAADNAAADASTAVQTAASQVDRSS